MSHPLLDIEFTEQAPQTYLSGIGKVFSVFDEHAQDSGNISYGVQVDQQGFFVKSAEILMIYVPFCLTRRE